MTVPFIEPGPDKSRADDHMKMNRGKALQTMGAMAAGIPCDSFTCSPAQTLQGLMAWVYGKASRFAN